MNKKQIYLIAVIILVIAFALMFLLQGINKNKTGIKLNKTQIECYETALYYLSNDGNISKENFAISPDQVRCLHGNSNYIEVEINGTYNELSRDYENQFYFQEITGGMAASGQDSYYEVCLIVNNKTVISKIETGIGMNYQSPARCSWQTKLP